MIVNTHRSPDGRLVVTLTDKDVIGKVYEQGEIVLDLSSPFFKGRDMDDEQAGILARGAYLVNANGRRSIELLKRLGFLREENVLKVAGIPHAQILR